MNAFRAALVTALLSFLLLPAGAQGQDCDESLSYQWRGYPVDMDLDGTTLAIADGAGLTLVDVGIASQARILSSIVTPAESLAVESLEPGRLALLTRDGLGLFDTSGDIPRLVDMVDVDGVHLHELSGDLVVVGAGITLVDITNDSLTVVDTVSLGAEAVASAVVGGAIYVSVPGSGTTRFGHSLAEDGRVGVVATAIAGEGTTVFLGRGGDGVFSVDFSTSSRPVVLQQLSGGVVADELVLLGGSLYASGEGGALSVIDVSDPSSMTVSSQTDATIDVMTGDERFLYSYGFSRDRFDRRIESEPYLAVRDRLTTGIPIVATLQESTGPLRGVATDGEIAWIADPPYVRAIDLSSQAELWSLRLDQPFDRVRFEGGRLVLYGRAWVHLIDPYASEPRLLGSWDTKGVADGGVTFSGPWLIEANKASGFHVLDIADPSNIYQRGGLINDGRGKWLDVVGMPGVVYGMVTRGLKVVALGNDPAAVAIVDFLQFDSITDVELVEVDGRPYLLVLDGSRVHVHDLSSPLHPVEIAVVEVAPGRQLAVDGTRAWVLADDGRVFGIELVKPSSPQPIGVWPGMREGLAIDVAGDVLVGADRWSMWATPLTDRALHETPQLGVTAQSEDVALLRWPSPPVSVTEVQLSRAPDFTQIERSWVTGGETVQIERTDEPAWVRARFVQGCSAGPWSAAVAIDAVEPRPGRARPVRRP